MAVLLCVQKIQKVNFAKTEIYVFYTAIKETLISSHLVISTLSNGLGTDACDRRHGTDSATGLYGIIRSISSRSNE